MKARVARAMPEPERAAACRSSSPSLFGHPENHVREHAGRHQGGSQVDLRLEARARLGGKGQEDADNQSGFQSLAQGDDE